MRAYPLFVRFDGRPVLVVGGGPVALEKALALVAAGASVTVVAPSIKEELLPVAHTVARRPFVPSDVDGVWLVIAAATSDVNREVKVAADERRVFVVAVDDVASCSAIGAAVLQRGDLTVAISSDGRAPALVALLRRALDALLPQEVAEWVDVASRAREAWKAGGVPLPDRRRRLLDALNATVDRGAA